MDSNDIIQRRFRNLLLSRPAVSHPAEVVDWLVAVQAQDFPGAKWSLGLRLHGWTDADIEQVFNQGAILRTHLLRPTWHFIRPADIRWLLQLTAPRVQAHNAPIYSKLGLDRATLARANDAMARAVEGKPGCTRDELRAALHQAGIDSTAPRRITYLLMSAELDGVLCSGPLRGRQFTYALLEERVPPAPAISQEEALVRLARRYFRSRGPASVHDFAKWSGLLISEAQRGLEAVQHELESVEIDGQAYWFPPGDIPDAQPSPHAMLLSIYDEYISSYKERSAIATPEIAARLVGQGAALAYILVLDGRIVGSFRRASSRNTLLIETNPYVPLTLPHHQAFAQVAGQLGAFVGQEVEFK